MIKCFFVDVKNISSNLPRSSFIELELDRLADSILATDGLLRPLILQEIGVEKYLVIEGHREYYAAVTAKKKDVKKAEMVNAFVINSNLHSSAIDQLNLLKEPQPPQIESSFDSVMDRRPLVEPLSVSIEQLLPTLLAAISQQIQPIVAQLADHKQILDLLKSDRQTQPQPKAIDISPAPIPLGVEPSKQPDIDEVTSVKIAQPPTKSKKIPKTKNISSSLIPDSVNSPKQPTQTEVNPTKIAKPTNSKSKKNSNFLESIDPIKENNTLKLINDLSQDQLTISMKRSVIPNAEKLAINIIAERNDRPEQKFDSWETIAAAKINGLGVATIKKIIDKLK